MSSPWSGSLLFLAQQPVDLVYLSMLNLQCISGCGPWISMLSFPTTGMVNAIAKTIRRMFFSTWFVPRHCHTHEFHDFTQTIFTLLLTFRCKSAWCHSNHCLSTSFLIHLKLQYKMIWVCSDIVSSSGVEVTFTISNAFSHFSYSPHHCLHLLTLSDWRWCAQNRMPLWGQTIVQDHAAKNSCSSWIFHILSPVSNR